MNFTDSINYDNKIYLLILIFSISFFILLIFYFISIIIYLKKNYHTKKISIFWINYTTTFAIVILFLGSYITNLIINKKERLSSPNSLSSNFFSIIINIFLVALIYSIINQILFDLIAAFIAYDKIKKFAKIHSESDYLELILKELNLQDILFNENSYFMYFIIFIILHLSFIIIYTFAYIDTNINRTNGFLNIETFFTYFLRIYYYIIIIGSMVYMIILSKCKNLLINPNYYSKNLFEMKIYKVYSDRALYYTNILNYDFIVQFILNIPFLFFLLLKLFNVIGFAILLISIFGYIYLGGTLYLNIDENNSPSEYPILLKKLFCFNEKTIPFRSKDINEIFNDLIYHYDINEKSKINELEITLFKKYNLGNDNSIDKNMHPLQINDDKIFNSSRKLFNFDPSLINKNIAPNKRNNSDFPKMNAKKVIDFTSLCDYYILYKLIYLYFQENKDVYDNLIKKMQDDTNIFKKILSESNPFKRKSSLGLNNSLAHNNTFGNNINKQDLITNIDRISRISIMDSKKIKTSLKVSSKNLFISLEEKDLFEEFKSKYGFKNSNIDFQIESLCSDSLFEIMPFVQLKVDDILKALIPSHNKKLFNIFIKKISPYKNKIEQNIFMTYDSLLIIEVYEKKEFISSENLNKFIFHYKNYLTNTVRNMGYSFLPLLIGIFNIQISGLNKIAIIYRNPLYFTLYNHFNNWITFYINESTEKLKASQILDDVIDLNEIEVKNALKINEADYEEVKNIFLKDLNLLKEINISIYPVVRLFIGDENGAIKAMDSNNLGYNKNYKATNMNEPSVLLDESIHKQQNLSELLEMSDFGNLSLSKKISNEFLENDLNSILEKEYYSMSGNDIHTIKIYFTNLFRIGNELSRKKREFLNDNKEDVSLSYRKFIEEELFIYLTKVSSFLDDNEKKEKENNDIEIILKKRMNLNAKILSEENKSDSSNSEQESMRKNSNKSESSDNQDKSREKMYYKIINNSDKNTYINLEES